MRASTLVPSPLASSLQRQFVLRLHLFVLAAIALGLLESAVFFGTYNSKNEVGPPFCSVLLSLPGAAHRPCPSPYA